MLGVVSSMVKSRAALQLENIALRHQIGVLQRSAKKRLLLNHADRLFWVALSRTWAEWRSALKIVKPDTVIAWHRNAFRKFWTWQSAAWLARTAGDLSRYLRADPPHEQRKFWVGAPRIPGELLKLCVDVAETSVSKYLVRSRKPPSQTWRTFLENHRQSLISVDFFTVPAIRFQILYVFLVLADERRPRVHFAVTGHSTAEWTAHQLREALPWRSLNRDRLQKGWKR